MPLPEYGGQSRNGVGGIWWVRDWNHNKTISKDFWRQKYAIMRSSVSWLP